MGVWDIKEFRTLCKYAHTDGLMFAESLAVKYRAARDYHQKNTSEKLKEAEVSKALGDLARLDLEIAWELDAFMNALNSMFDILAQLINECLCSPKFPVEGVNIHKVKGWDVPKEIVQIIDNATMNELFNMIRGYSNVSKHRYAIKGDVHVDFSGLYVNTSYYSKEFTYKSKDTQHISDHELSNYLKFAGGVVDQVGMLLNRELLARNTRKSPQL